MTDDDLLRLLLTVGTGCLLPVPLVYRIRSQSTGEKLDRWQEGWVILFGLRLTAFMGLLAILGFILRPTSMGWSAVQLPFWLRASGLGIGVAAGLLLIWTFHTLGRNLTDTVVTRREHTLVVHGPYRYVRHPFYLAFGLAVAAGSLVTANWFVLLTGLVVMTFLVVRTRKEEANLVLRFGDAYTAYAALTGRFWPRLGRSVPLKHE